MPSSEYLRRQAELYWRLSLATSDDDLRRNYAELAQRFTAQAEALEAGPTGPAGSPPPPGEDETPSSS